MLVTADKLSAPTYTNRIGWIVCRSDADYSYEFFQTQPQINTGMGPDVSIRAAGSSGPGFVDVTPNDGPV